MSKELFHSSKVENLARLLDGSGFGASGLPSSVGIHVMLWHFITDHAPMGDVGKFSNEEIAEALYWEHNPNVLIELLIEAETLECHAVHRLSAKNWPESYMSFTRGTFTGTGFHDGSQMSRHYALPSDWDKWSNRH